MKKLSLLLFAVITTLFLNSCSKEDTKVNEPTTTAFTVYKNQTGDANADALQAQNTDSKGTLNFYGAFDSENNPKEIRTLTYQKANNDTIVNLIIDPLTNRLASSYFSVKGVKSPVVLKFDYIEGVSNAYNLSYYNYNWEKETSELLYATRVETDNGVASSNRFLANKGVEDDVKLLIKTTVGSIAYFEIIVPVIPGLVKVGAAVLAAAAAAPVLTAAAIGAAIVIFVPKDAFSKELVYTPSNLPPPSKTPIINPVPATSNPTQNLQTSSCINTQMTFRASMDAEGSIMITEVAGGQSPYTYMVGSGFQQSQVFPNKYKDGSYVVSVKDANGCVSTKLVSLKRTIDCANSTLAITVTSLNNTATVSASGGLSPYTYSWSNGSTSATATSLPNGNHTVTVTDALGCTKKGTASINFADYRITGASIGGFTDDVTLCPTAYKSGNAMVGVSFNNTTPPASGSISLTVYWDNNADGVFDGNGAGSIDIASSQKTGNTVYAVRGFCWGSKNTVLKVEFKYTSSTGAQSIYIIPSL